MPTKEGRYIAIRLSILYGITPEEYTHTAVIERVSERGVSNREEYLVKKFSDMQHIYMSGSTYSSVSLYPLVGEVFTNKVNQQALGKLGPLNMREVTMNRGNKAGIE